MRSTLNCFVSNSISTRFLDDRSLRGSAQVANAVDLKDTGDKRTSTKPKPNDPHGIVVDLHLEAPDKYTSGIIKAGPGIFADAARESSVTYGEGHVINVKLTPLPPTISTQISLYTTLPRVLSTLLQRTFL